MDSIIGQAAIFRGVEPGVVQPLTDGLVPMEFEAGHGFFAQGDRLYVIAPAR